MNNIDFINSIINDIIEWDISVKNLNELETTYDFWATYVPYYSLQWILLYYVDDYFWFFIKNHLNDECSDPNINLKISKIEELKIIKDII